MEQNESNRRGSGVRIGFLCCKVLTEDGGYAGGLLVTDERGLPKEFHYSHPIKPTPAQRIIYGAALERYVACDLIGMSLYTALSEQPEAFLVDDQMSLDVRKGMDVPVLFIRRLGDPMPAGIGGALDLDATVEIGVDTPGYAPIAMTPAAGYSGDSAEVSQRLGNILESLDLIEPFDRVRKAIAQILKQLSGN